MIANRTLVAHKCAGVVKTYAELAGIPLREALDTFYRSSMFYDIRHGISHMHCRSDMYLAEELQIELERKGSNGVYPDQVEP